MSRNKILVAPIFVLLVALVMAVYDIKFNSDDYAVLLKNRFPKLGFGIELCSDESKNCMKDYKNSFEIWHFAHTVHGGIAEKRLYPSFQ